VTGHELVTWVLWGVVTWLIVVISAATLMRMFP